MWCTKRALEGRHRNGRSPRLDWAPPPTRQSCATTVFCVNAKRCPVLGGVVLFWVDRLGSRGDRQGKRGRGMVVCRRSPFPGRRVGL